MAQWFHAPGRIQGLDPVTARLGVAMTENWEEVMGAALSLPPGMRAMLAEHLLESLDAENHVEIAAAWATVAEARIAEIDSGRVELSSAESVLERIKAGR